MIGPYHMDEATLRALREESARRRALLAERRLLRAQPVDVELDPVIEPVVERRSGVERRSFQTMQERLAAADRSHVERRQYAETPEPLTDYSQLRD